MQLTGIGASRGVAIAPARVYCTEDISISRTTLGDMTPAEAEKKVAAAIDRASGELAALMANCPGREQREIFQAHQAILLDEELEALVTEHIREDCYGPAYAVYTGYNEFSDMLSQLEDANIALRAGDIRDVRNRLLRCLDNRQETRRAEGEGARIVVAHDLLPSEIAVLANEQIRGFVLETGGLTSHTAILARSLGIPALLGAVGAVEAVRCGDMLLLDALSDTLTVNPNPTELAAGQERLRRWQSRSAALAATAGEEARTSDGVGIQMGINIASDTAEIPAYADFVGLFRTEFLYMNSDHLPTEEEQFAAYRRVLENAQNRPVTLRTLDIGGDKTLPYLTLPKEENPFLGVRAIRLCFERRDLFLTQLCAALRASVFGKLQLMFPMIGSMEDIRRAKICLEDAKNMLRSRGEPFDESIPVGIMIEIPSIALIADLAAKEVDFASIGTNDLCQYLCAADRMDTRLTAYNQPFSPAMLRLLGNVVGAFQREKKEISLCGELAGDERAAKVLTGLGLRKFSMSRESLLPVKAKLRDVDSASARACYEKAIRCATQEEVLSQVQEDDAGTV